MTINSRGGGGKALMAWPLVEELLCGFPYFIYILELRPKRRFLFQLLKKEERMGYCNCSFSLLQSISYGKKAKMQAMDIRTDRNIYVYRNSYTA